MREIEGKICFPLLHFFQTKCISKWFINIVINFEVISVYQQTAKMFEKNLIKSSNVKHT